MKKDGDVVRRHGGTRTRHPWGGWLLLALWMGCGGDGARPEAGPDGARPAEDGGREGSVQDGGGPDGDGGEPVAPLGPAPLLDRLVPSQDDMAARSYEDLVVADESWPALAALELPRRIAFALDPEDESSRVPLCLRWGIMTSGVHRFPTAEQSVRFLGSEVLGPQVPGRVRDCHFVASRDDFYGCSPTCPELRAREGFSLPDRAADDPADVEAYVDGFVPVRLLHPFMVAYPCGEDDERPRVRTDRAAILTTQFATPGTGTRWANAFEESGVRGDNDVEGAEVVWQRAWELAAREGAFVLWLGDVSFPRRWYPAAPRSEDNPLGIQCDSGQRTGWYEANTWTGLQFFAMLAGARAAGDQPLPDEFLAAFSAMPYVRALSSGATLLQRLVERDFPEAPGPRRFSVEGTSKGGMGCAYAVLADPRIEHGVCGMFEAFDVASPRDMMNRMVTDWGLCLGNGLRPRPGGGACATGNFPGFPGVQMLALTETRGVAMETFRDTWELGRSLTAMERAAPGDRIFFLQASTDFHWSAGSNDAIWERSGPTEDQVWTLYAMNGDHGMVHLPPDDAPDGLTARDWQHGVQHAMAYRSFFRERRPLQVSWLELPRVRDGRLVARVRVRSERPVGGVQAWVAASTDRDFSFCTGMELPEEAFVCYGKFLCGERDETVASEGCPGAHLASCRWVQDLVSRYDRLTDADVVEMARGAVALPTRLASNHHCWWRWDDGSGREPSEQCVLPLGRDAWRPGDPLPRQRLLREVKGTWGEVLVRDLGFSDGFPPDKALPSTFRFRRYGDERMGAVLRRWGFVDPYERNASGEFRFWDSGYFVPREVVLRDDGTAELSWELPPGTDVDHFAVTFSAWDAPAAAGAFPDVVYAPIVTVAPEPDPDVLRCE